jgi:molybdopterin synthase catalytic subunit
LKNMRVQLLPFGILKEHIGTESLELPSDATVADLLSRLDGSLADSPAARQLLPRIAVSINAEYAQRNSPLKEGDQVGLLPPVSGGVDGTPSAITTYLTRDVIPALQLLKEIKRGSDGAVAIFDGIVRDNTRGRQTLYLDYEAYEEMAAAQIRELAERAVAQFGVRAVTLVHRLGRLQVGETSVLIVVASAHRGAAFDACRWLIDTLKKAVPIWKKETFVDGAVWADGEPFPEGILAGTSMAQSTGSKG